MALDEKLITHDNEIQTWVGVIDTTNKNVRLDILPQRNRDNLKFFVQNPIIPGNTITHDGWLGYNFLVSEDSVWPHQSHNHGHCDFGTGSNSTSHIESYLSQFKNLALKLYPIFPHKRYIYFIRQIEFRTKISGKTNDQIISIFFKLFKNVNDYCDYDFSYEEEILDCNN